VDAYERDQYPIDLPGPIEAIRFRLEQLDADAGVLVGMIGNRRRVDEILHGRRRFL